jgi:hypothetical protein
MRPVVAPQSIEHALAFAAAGALFAFAYELRLAGVIVAAIAYPLLIEVVQIVIPGRHARISDFLVDASGAVLGSAIGYTLRQTAIRYDTASRSNSYQGLAREAARARDLTLLPLPGCRGGMSEVLCKRFL